MIFPVRWWDRREFTISFTPVEDGSVELNLSGLWVEEKSGTAVSKEVLWDDLTAEGTQLTNGGFEALQNGKPEYWKPVSGDYLAADAWPLTKVPTG